MCLVIKNNNKNRLHCFIAFFKISKRVVYHSLFLIKVCLDNLPNLSCVCFMKVPRTEWVLKWPGQVVIAGCQTYWTSDVSQALNEGVLPQLHQKMLGQVYMKDIESGVAVSNALYFYIIVLCQSSH